MRSKNDSSSSRIERNTVHGNEARGGASWDGASGGDGGTGFSRAWKMALWHSTKVP